MLKGCAGCKQRNGGLVIASAAQRCQANGCSSQPSLQAHAPALRLRLRIWHNIWRAQKLLATFCDRILDRRYFFLGPSQPNSST
jgi:hypothetical protein